MFPFRGFVKILCFLVMKEIQKGDAFVEENDKEHKEPMMWLGWGTQAAQLPHLFGGRQQSL